MAALAHPFSEDTLEDCFLFQYGINGIVVSVPSDVIMAFQMLNDMLVDCSSEESDKIIPSPLVTNSNGPIAFTALELSKFFELFQILGLTSETKLLKTYENVPIQVANDILQNDILPNVVDVLKEHNIDFELALKFLVLANHLHHEGYMHTLAYYIAQHYKGQFLSSLHPSELSTS
jgi:hypothetical protein